MRNVILYQHFFRTRRFTLRRFVQGGFLFGLCFPALAITLDLVLHQYPLSWSSVIRIHQANPIHYVVDTAPWVLSMTAYLIGWMVQDKEQQVRQHIVDSEKKLYHVLQHNPDAVFLVRTDDFIIERCNLRALELCEIEPDNPGFKEASVLFSSLHESLAILKKLRQAGDTFSAELPCTTAAGRNFWGQVTMYTFSLNDRCYQLIRIADISPVKERELELQKIKHELQLYSEELQSANEEVTAINNNLEQLVKERTELLQLRNAQLAEYAFLNAHKIRGPLTRVLGSAYALEYADGDYQKQQLIQHVIQSAKELDRVIHQMAAALTMADEGLRTSLIEPEKREK